MTRTPLIALAALAVLLPGCGLGGDYGGGGGSSGSGSNETTRVEVIHDDGGRSENALDHVELLHGVAPCHPRPSQRRCRQNLAHRHESDCRW